MATTKQQAITKQQTIQDRIGLLRANQEQLIESILSENTLLQAQLGAQKQWMESVDNYLKNWIQTLEPGMKPTGHTIDLLGSLGYLLKLQDKKGENQNGK